jgi:hypothetical protein
LSQDALGVKTSPQDTTHQLKEPLAVFDMQPNFPSMWGIFATLVLLYNQAYAVRVEKGFWANICW